MLPPSNLYAHVFAVKTHLTPRENLHLLEIGLKGNCKAEMKDGVTSFTGLKFKSTSYNNEVNDSPLVSVSDQKGVPGA